VVAAGVHIVPLMAADDVISVALEAEYLGYDYCLIADEGLQPDIYACIGVIARETERMTIGVATNGYTRHPATTAAAMATVDDMSGGRAVVTMLAGGSMVLGPMAIPRTRPYRVLDDAIQTMQLLWTGEEVSFDGETCSLDRAQLGLGRRNIPIWIASRGPMVLGLAGRSADGVILTVKPDLGAALDLVEDAAQQAGRPRPQSMYLGRICYTTELLEGQRRTLSYVLMDSPRRVLESLGLDDQEIGIVEDAARGNSPALVDPLATDELLRRYQIAGSPAECADEVATLARDHELQAVLIDALSADLDENLAVIRNSLPIIRGDQL
jgi:5,10-methylenetetrahydromethanopterin reductase